ncbi:MAG: hypothetical protein ABSF70_06430 [Terracidiphilus sp.]|jgi:hypothetical protein
MRWFQKTLAPLLLTTTLAIAPFSIGCEDHAGVYDPYHHDYHEWAPEAGHYSQWERENHKDHMDFNKRSDDDKKAYWDWRHSSDHH